MLEAEMGGAWSRQDTKKPMGWSRAAGGGQGKEMRPEVGAWNREMGSLGA